MEDHKRFMKIALEISKRAKGFTEPNPLVGAAVVKNNRIISTGYHQTYGGDHAERNALRHVRVKGVTMYVSLEPCVHKGKTPPCVDLILRKKVKRVVVALKDPNPLVNGKGIAFLKRNGIDVMVGILERPARMINRHYLRYITKNIPYVTLRAGVSLDGKMTDQHRRSRWVTSTELRDLSHSLRGEFSAILVGSRTVNDDNPRLTICKDEWGKKNFYRVVLDTQNSLHPDLNIFKNQRQYPLIIFSSKNAKNQDRKTQKHYFIDAKGQDLDLFQILSILARNGIASVLVEGGGRVIDAFLKHRMHDELILFVANKMVGGKEAVELFFSGVDNLKEAQKFEIAEIIHLSSGYILRGYR